MILLKGTYNCCHAWAVRLIITHKHHTPEVHGSQRGTRTAISPSIHRLTKYAPIGGEHIRIEIPSRAGITTAVVNDHSAQLLLCSYPFLFIALQSKKLFLG